MDKNILIQYADMQEEIKEIRGKINKLEKEMRKVEDDISKIETARDKVKGGMGGNQSFCIEGYQPEYERKRSALLEKKILLNSRNATLDILELNLLRTTNEVEEYIISVDDSLVRRIINLRVLEKLTWNKIACRIGGGNTEDSVKKVFYRFVNE